MKIRAFPTYRLLGLFGILVAYAPAVSATPRRGYARSSHRKKAAPPRRASAKKRAVLNRLDAQGFTPLMRACSYLGANFDRAKRLLGSGADPNIQNAQGETALMLAINTPPINVEDMPDFVHLLLRFGAKPNLQNARGDTALTIACSEHRVEGQAEAWAQADAINDAMPEAYAKIVLDLRRHGARLDFKNKDGQTALDLALNARMGSSQTHRPEIVAALKAPLK